MNIPQTFLLLTFFLAQVGVVFYLRGHPTVTDPRRLLAVFEIAIVFFTTVFYLALRPKKEASAKKTESLPPQPSEKKTPEPPFLQDLQKSQQQAKELEESVRRLEQEKSIVQQQVVALEQRDSDRTQKVDSLNLDLQNTVASLSASALTIQDLTNDIEQLAIQLEQEHRQHAIEIRTLLGKDPSSLSKKKPPRTSLSPISTLLLLLSQFQKSMEYPQSPPSDYRPFVRRKFFDFAKQFGATPFAIFSIDQPSDYFLSPKIPPTLSVHDFLEVILSQKRSFERLQSYQPFHFSDPRLGESRWTAFRISYDHLSDLVILAPAHITRPINSHGMFES